MKKWSRKYDKCIECGSTEKRHCGNGRCSACHSKAYYKKNGIKIRAKRKALKAETFRRVREQYGSE